MKHIVKYIAVITMLFVTYKGFAVENNYKNIINKVETKIPEIKIDTIEKSEIPGILRITSAADVFYISEDGNYLIYGEMIDINQPKDKWLLTENYRKQARIKLINNLDENSMIIFAPGAGIDTKATVTVFTDIDCGFCRKMHRDMQEINKLGIKVRYLAFPRSGPNTDSFQKAESVWCAKDKQQAITAAKHGDKIEEISCNNPVEQEYKLGIDIGIRGTPTIIFEDGTMLPSYLPPEKLLEAALKYK